MIVLALDTTGGDCSVAVWEKGQELSFEEKNFERNQAAFLPQFVREVMGPKKIDEILVNIGPGSFTGIRVGIAFAKGLAMGWNIPLKGMDSFTASYESLNPTDNVFVIIDAKRTDVYARQYVKGIPQNPQSLTREDLEKILLSPHPPLLTGNGLHPFLDGLFFEEAISPWRGAQKLAYSFFKNPNLVSEALPFYLREADVTYGSPQQCI
jgi:tRNA threonylcarbamoyladenosine biosynthesis protein TsaB